MKLGTYAKRVTLVASAFLLAIGIFATSAFASAPSSILGTVSDTHGPLAGASVTAWRDNSGTWTEQGSVFSGATGAYALTDLLDGDYVVQFQDPSHGHVSEFYNNVQSLVPGDARNEVLHISAGASISSVNATLEDTAVANLGAIKGTVTADGGGALSGVLVELHSQVGGVWTYSGYRLTDATGAYNLADVAPGPYRLRFSLPGSYLTECYSDVAGADVANSACTTVTVGDGQIVEGVDAALAPAGRITGTVTSSRNGSVLSGIEVTPYLHNAVADSWSAVTGSFTNVSGVYAITGLVAGTYRLYFSDPDAQYVAEYYDDVSAIDVSDAGVTNIVVAAGGVVGGRNAALALPFVPGEEPDAFEPDDTTTTARLVVPDLEETHTLYPENDKDWIAVDGTARTGYTIETGGTSDTDTYIEVFNAASVLVAQDDDTDYDDTDSSTFARLTYTPSVSGTFYVKVRGAMPGSIGAYTLEVTAIDAPPIQPTFLSAKASPTALSKYGSSTTVSGVLRVGSASGAGLTGQSVRVEASANGSSGWSSIATVTSGPGGAVSKSFVPRSKTYYRLTYAGAGDIYSASESAKTAAVLPRVYIGSVSASRYGTRSYTLRGDLKPRHAAGTYPVHIYRWKYVSGKWKPYSYVIKAKAADYVSSPTYTYTRYSVKYKFPSTGKWRLRAYHPADSGHPSGWSSYSYLTVK